MADLDADVRRHDEDRWLASRFAPADVRARLIAIYALNYEIARTAEVVSTPALVEIRLDDGKRMPFGQRNRPEVIPGLRIHAPEH